MAGFHEETPAADSLPALGKACSLNNGKLDHGQGSTSPPCPQCGSAKTWKDGVRETSLGPVQRYLCRRCGYRFSDPNSKQAQTLFNGSGMSEHVETIHTKTLKSQAIILSNCRVSNEPIGRASTGQLRLVKSLAEVETRKQERAAGATVPDQATIKGKLLQFALWMQKQGYTEQTIKAWTVWLKGFVKLGVNLWDPETVKEILGKQKKWSSSYKMLLMYAYESFLEMENITWTRPKYTQTESFPFIPTEQELDQLISAASKVIGTFLQGLKDTGADPGELAKLKWIDVNKEARTVNIKPVKGHNPRILKVSQQFIDRLERLPKTSELIFPKSRNLSNRFFLQRKRIAYKLNNPRLLKISFRTFRHWKGTIEYHRTRDILHVKKILGHKSIQNTIKYIDIEANLFGITEDQYTVKVATNVEDACKLIETGFEYVTGEYGDGGKIFRKRK